MTLEYERTTHSPFTVLGDPVRFAHILTILISNAIEAYEGYGKGRSMSVVIAERIERRRLVITVSDYGKGISLAARGRLFKPFASDKPNGMGIGLFMAHEMARRHFDATLTLDPDRDKTVFILSIPKAGKRRERA